MANNPTKYAIEWRDKNGVFKQQLQPWAKDVKWEWNRQGGCGRASIKLAVPYREHVFSALDDIQIRIGEFIQPNLYFHLKCNDNAASKVVTDDGSGANNGVSSTNTENLSVAGKINNGFEFDGSTEYIDVDALLADISLDTKGSFSFWIEPDDVGLHTVFSIGDESDNSTYFTITISGQDIWLAFKVLGTTQWSYSTSLDYFPINTYVHVVVIHDGIVAKIYINGVLATAYWDAEVDKTQWFADLTDADSCKIAVKRIGGVNSNFVDGELDDFRYYKNYVLSSSEITTLYNSGKGIETTYKNNLAYRGWVSGVNPVLKNDQEIILDIRGYFDLLKYIVVQDSGDTKDYASTRIDLIVDDIIDTFAVANSDITKGTIDAAGFTADALSFKNTVENALRTLADLEGGVEYGVDENLVFFWYDESATVNKKFFVGDDIKILQRKEDFSKIVNKYYLEGKETAGVPFIRSGENATSQTTYFLAEAIIQNGAISTNSVADQLIAALLNANDAPKYQMNLTIPNTKTRLEDTVPLGKISIYDVDYDQFTAARKIWGTTYNGGDNILWGTTANSGSNLLYGGGSGVFQDQVDFIRYQLSETDGRFTMVIGTGGSRDETAGKIKQIELDLQNIRQGRS